MAFACPGLKIIALDPLAIIQYLNKLACSMKNVLLAPSDLLHRPGKFLLMAFAPAVYSYDIIFHSGKQNNKAVRTDSLQKFLK